MGNMNDDLLNEILTELQAIRMVLELSAPKDLKKLIEGRLAQLDKEIADAQVYDAVAPEEDQYGKVRASSLEKQRDMLKAYLTHYFPG